jgi:MoaD family protein
MKTHLRFFSRLRDLTGKSEMELDVPEGAKVADLLETLYAQTPALREWDRSILVASGVEFVTRDHALTPGDDISIMPPVQGG